LQTGLLVGQVRSAWKDLNAIKYALFDKLRQVK
jgi:hypothetical protein